MRRTKVSLVILITLALSAGFLACGGGGGGGGGISSTPALQSTNSVHHEDITTDGNWFVWTGRSEGILSFDGTDVRDLTRDLEGLAAKELAFDGRYVGVRAVDTSKASGEESETGHVGIYYYDTDSSSPGLMDIQLTDADVSWVGDMAMADGLLVWGANLYLGGSALYAYDIATGTGPVKISGSVSVSSTDAHANVAGDRVVWDDGSGIFFADVSNLAAFSAASDIVEISTTGSDPRVDGDVVVWEYSDNIWCDDLADAYGTPVNITADLTNDSYDPNVSGTTVIFERYDDNDYEIYIADVSDLANFDSTLGTGDVQQLTDNSSTEGDPQIAGDFVAWFGGDDDEIYGTDLSAGLGTAIADIVQVSDGYYHSFEYHDYDESWYAQNFLLDDLGNIIWTEFDEEGDTSEWYELAYHYNIADATSADTADLGYFVRIKQLELVNGESVMIVRDAFERIFAKEAGGGPPAPISPQWMRGHQPVVNDGVVAWSGKPGYLCDDSSGTSGVYWEIYYADLNSGSNPAVNQVTMNNFKDKKPAVDGDGGIILWKGDDGSRLEYYWIGDPAGVVHELFDTGSYSVRVDDGLVAWRDGSDVYYWNISDPDDDITEISGGVTASRCPVIDNGVIAFKSNDTGYDIYYYDTMDAAPALKKATSVDVYVDSSNPQIGLSDGSIVFYGYPGASTSGSDTVYVYNIGDPADSLTIAYQTTDTAYEIRCTDVDSGVAAFIAEVDGDSFSARELFTYRISSGELTQVTDNNVADDQVEMGGGKVLFREGGTSSGAMSRMVYALSP